MQNGIGPPCDSPTYVCGFTLSANGIARGCLEGFTVQIDIYTQINSTTYGEKQSILFGCDYDQCNSNETFRKLKDLIDQHYDLSPLHKALANTSAIATTNITSTPNGLTDSQQTKKSTDHLLATSNKSPSTEHVSTKVTSSTTNVQPTTTSLKTSTPSTSSTVSSSTTTESNSCCSMCPSYIFIICITFGTLCLFI